MTKLTVLFLGTAKLSCERGKGPLKCAWNFTEKKWEKCRPMLKRGLVHAAKYVSPVLAPLRVVHIRFGRWFVRVNQWSGPGNEILKNSRVPLNSTCPRWPCRPYLSRENTVHPKFTCALSSEFNGYASEPIPLIGREGGGVSSPNITRQPLQIWHTTCSTILTLIREVAVRSDHRCRLCVRVCVCVEWVRGLLPS